MSYILSGTTLRSPSELKEANNTQVAQKRTLDGSVNRDYFGNNKRVWYLSYDNVNSTDYATIKAIHDAYLASSTAVAWEVTETNYTISATTVHIDLVERSFGVKGSDYLSDFTLVLSEA